MSLTDAMRRACAQVGIVPPRSIKRGRWTPCPVEGKPASNGSGRVLLWDDGTGGTAWNWITNAKVNFRADGEVGKAPRIDREAMQHKLRQEAERHAQVAAICAGIVRACTACKHPYLERKGFPDEVMLVVDDPRPHIPRTELGEAIIRALPEGGPLLVAPGWIGRDVRTVQFIAPDGSKKNILGGEMGGASLRIATGRETWVCEGIATALSVRAALRLLGRSATVLSAFSAANVGKVAKGIPRSVIAADHDKPQDTLHGLGAGEFYARQSGRPYAMPPEVGDWNDHHMAHDLRTVALRLREVCQS